jgi:hypothetical protein
MKCTTRVPSSLIDLQLDNMRSLHIMTEPRTTFAYLPYTRGLVAVLKKFGQNLLTLATAPVNHKGDTYNQILDLVPNLETLEMTCEPTASLLNWRLDLSTIRLPHTLKSLKFYGVRISPSMLRDLRSNPRTKSITSVEITSATGDTVKLRELFDGHPNVLKYSSRLVPFGISPLGESFTVWTAEFY